MITQGPFTLTLGDTLPLNDPGATSNNPATAVQIQNASPFIIEVNSGGIVLTIQSFTAQTVLTSGGGQQMTVDPITSGANAQTVAPASLTVVWLLAGEQAPMGDGPLTAAAISSSLGAAGLSGVAVLNAFIAVGAGTSGFISTPLPDRLKVWNLGFEPDSLVIGWPTMGGIMAVLGSSPQAVDTLGFGIGSSNRLAGLITSNSVEFFNYTDKTLLCYIDYSAA